MEETSQEYARLREVFESFMPYLFAAGRFESFNKKWPYKSPNLSPQKMAEAGFMYSPDPFDPGCVKCPFCLKELSSWEEDDNPISEHRRYMNRCYFARLDKKEEEYTLRDVLLLVTNTRAALLEKEVYDMLDRMEQSYSQMVEKMERQVHSLLKTDANNVGGNCPTKLKKKKLRK